MKHIFLIGLVVFSCFLVGCGGGKSLVGIHKQLYIKDLGGNDLYYEFTNDGKFAIYHKTIKPERGNFTADAGKSPMQVDIKMSGDGENADGSSKYKAYSTAAIYKFEGNELSIRMANPNDPKGEAAANVRPSDWNGDDDGYYTRKYEATTSTIPADYQK